MPVSCSGKGACARGPTPWKGPDFTNKWPCSRLVSAARQCQKLHNWRFWKIRAQGRPAQYAPRARPRSIWTRKFSGVESCHTREYKMTNILETLSWIAAVVAIPVAVIGWFFASGKEKINKSRASRGGKATSGDVRVDGTAGIVTGHHSPMNVHLTVGGNGSHVYEKRNTMFKITRKLIDEAT